MRPGRLLGKGRSNSSQIMLKGRSELKSRWQVVTGIVLVLALIGTAGAAPTGFSLARYGQSQPTSLKLGLPPTPVAEENYRQGAEAHKRPWIAALEVTSINVMVWLIDRYVRNVDYSHISWDTIKYNFQHGFIWDNDNYGTGFAGHPYHGSQYYNAARSLGLNVWESIPYAAAGYLMWGFIFENDQPSWNDTITTTLGGVSLGEIEYRLSSQVLDDSATGGSRVGREILAFLIDPIRGLNRLIYGDSFRTSAMNAEKREPLHGDLTLSGMLVSDAGNLSQLHFSPGLMFDMVYGMDASGINVDHPFDLIVFNGDVRYSHFQSRGYLTLSTYGPWVAKEWEDKSGDKFVLGLFQHYDYLNNEALAMGGTSTTLGFVSLVPLGQGIELKSSIQAGGLLIGGIRNDYVQIEDRNYNYGVGFTGKADVWLTHPAWGSLNLHFSHFRSWSINAAVPDPADKSRDVLTLFNAEYSFPVTNCWTIAIDYGRFALRQHFDGHPETIRDSSRVGAAVGWHF